MRESVLRREKIRGDNSLGTLVKGIHIIALKAVAVEIESK